MDQIFTSVQQVAGYMADITSASEEQSDGIEQVNQAISQMDEMTQHNAALVEQAAAAAENMQHQASKLALVVNTFKLVSGGHATHIGTAPRVCARTETPHLGAKARCIDLPPRQRNN